MNRLDAFLFKWSARVFSSDLVTAVLTVTAGGLLTYALRNVGS